MSKIKEKLQNQKDKLQKEMDKLNGMLSNEKFIKNAPQNIIDANKKNLEDTKNKLQKVQKEIDEKDF
jgi:valyl-tRNA synthetase